MRGLLTCDCGRISITTNPSNACCARCREIERQNALDQVRFTNIKGAEHTKQTTTRYNQDRRADGLVKSLIPPVPEGCDLYVDGYKRYYL